MRLPLRGLCAAILISAGAAQASPLFVATGNNDFLYESDTLPRFGIAYPTAPSEVFVAQARIGNRAVNGDYEIGLHRRQTNPATPPTNVAPLGTAAERQFAWASGTLYTFTLARNGQTASFVMGNYSESWTNSAVADVNAISFRVRGGSQNGTTALTELVYTGNGTAGQPLRSFSSNLTSGPDLALFGKVEGNFTLTGKLMFTWTGAPGGSALSMQLKALEGFVIPEPSAMVLLLAGVSGLAGAIRLRHQSA